VISKKMSGFGGNTISNLPQNLDRLGELEMNGNLDLFGQSKIIRRYENCKFAMPIHNFKLTLYVWNTAIDNPLNLLRFIYYIYKYTLQLEHIERFDF